MTSTPVAASRPSTRSNPVSSIMAHTTTVTALRGLRLPDETWDQFFERVIFRPWGRSLGVEPRPAGRRRKPKEDPS